MSLSNYHKGWTHTAPLLRACGVARGPILEYGVGHFSTSLLSEWSRITETPLVSVEHDPEWAGWAKEHFTHEILTGDYGVILPALLARDTQWGVIFLDDAAESRIATLTTFRDRATCFVVHDVGVEASELEALKSIPHLYLETRWTTPTIVASHIPFPDVSGWRVLR